MVVALGTWALVRPFPEQLSERAATMEAELVAAQPQVVLIGNSMIGRGADLDQLSQALGVPVARAKENGSSAATWYTLIKNRVLGAGLQPRVVIIAATAQGMLRTGSPNEFDQRALLDHLGDHEPAVWLKTYGRTSPNRLQASADRRRRDLRAATIQSVRRWGAALAGSEELDAAMNRIFEAEGAVDEDLRTRVIPIVEVDADDARQLRQDAADIDATYVPDLLQLADDSGFKLVFVRMPLRPGNGSDALPAADLSALIAALNEGGAGWLDLSTMALGPRDFVDPSHVGPSGRQAFTEALAHGLQRIGALGTGPMQQAFVVETTPATRSGTLPPLGSLTVREQKKPKKCVTMLDPDPAALPYLASFVGLSRLGLADAIPLRVTEEGLPLGSRKSDDPGACGGTFRMFRKGIKVKPRTEAATRYALEWIEDVPLVDHAGQGWLWLLPGTEIGTTLPEPPPGPVQLRARTWAVKEGAAAPVLLVDGQEQGQAREERGRWIQELSLPAAPHRVALRLPQDGTPTVVEGVVLATGEREAWILGSPVLARPGSSQLLGAKKDTARYSGEPEPLDAGQPDKQGRRIKIPVPGLAGVDGAACGKATKNFGCTPVQPLRGGQPLEAEPLPCNKTRKAEPGAWCHHDEMVEIVVDKQAKASAYTLRLNPQRQVGRSWWLYPGDTLTTRGRSKERAYLRAGAAALRLDLRPMTSDPDQLTGTLRVRVELKDTVYLDQAVPIAELTDAPFDLSFLARTPRLVPPPVTLSTSADAPFLLVEELHLLEQASDPVEEHEEDGGDEDTGVE